MLTAIAMSTCWRWAVGCLDNQEAAVNRRIEQALGEAVQDSQDDRAPGPAVADTDFIEEMWSSGSTSRTAETPVAIQMSAQVPPLLVVNTARTAGPMTSTGGDRADEVPGDH
jgi:hypothetical protein